MQVVLVYVGLIPVIEILSAVDYYEYALFCDGDEFLVVKYLMVEQLMHFYYWSHLQTTLGSTS